VPACDELAVPDRSRQLLAELDHQVECLRTSAGWRRWVTFASRFTDYSLNNQLLILMQRPDATHVAGYKAWQSMGRQVNAGERGIRIFAPSTHKTEDDDGQCVRILTGFRVVRVFDISQTSGEPIPTLTLPAVAGSSDALFDQLKAAAAAESLDVVTRHEPPEWDGPRGWIDHETRTITLVDYGQGVDSLSRTLLHELAHWCDPVAAVCEAKHANPCLEIVAESAAWIVGTAVLGLDMLAASATYVATWREDLDALDTELTAELAAHTLDVARRLEHVVTTLRRDVASGRVWPARAIE